MSASVARWVSIIAHPFVMVTALVIAVAFRRGISREAVPALLLVIAVGLLPVGFLMVRQVRRGSWANVDASNRSERPILFVVGIVGLITLLGCTFFVHPVSFLFRGGVVVLAMISVCAVANRWLKVSLHMAFGALAATALVFLGSPVGWVLAVVLPALAWSRLTLGRHERSEVAAGLVLGFLAGYAVYRF